MNRRHKMDLGKMIKDVKNILTNTVPAMFEGDLRSPNTRAPLQKAQPQLDASVDKPVNQQPAYQPVPLTQASPDYNTRASANNGSLFVYGDKFNGQVTADQYDQFINNKKVFEEMIDKWTTLDDPQSRINTVKQYSDKYGFADNLILGDLLDGLWQYDNAQVTGAPSEPKDWTLEARQSWNDWVKENMNYAANRYDPKKRIKRA